MSRIVALYVVSMTLVYALDQDLAQHLISEYQALI